MVLSLPSLPVSLSSSSFSCLSSYRRRHIISLIRFECRHQLNQQSMHPVVAVCNTDGTRQGIIQGQIIDTFAAMRNASEAARYLSAHANPLNSIIPFRSSHLITVFKRMKDCLDRKAVWGWPPENLLETEEGVAWGERACGAGRIWSRSVSSPASTGRPPLIPSALTLDPLSSACSPCIGGVSLRFGFKVVTRGHWHVFWFRVGCQHL